MMNQKRSSRLSEYCTSGIQESVRIFAKLKTQNTKHFGLRGAFFIHQPQVQGAKRLANKQIFFEWGNPAKAGFRVSRLEKLLTAHVLLFARHGEYV